MTKFLSQEYTFKLPLYLHDLCFGHFIYTNIVENHIEEALIILFVCFI